MQGLHSGTRTQGINIHRSSTHTLHPDRCTHHPDTQTFLPCTSHLPALTLLHLFHHPISLSTPPLPLSSIQLSLLLSGHQTPPSPFLTSLLLLRPLPLLLLLSDAQHIPSVHVDSQAEQLDKLFTCTSSWLCLSAVLIRPCNHWL